MKPGARVSALRDLDENTLWLYGHGVYVGDRRRPDVPSDGLLETARALAASIPPPDPALIRDRVEAEFAHLGISPSPAEVDARVVEIVAAETEYLARPADERAAELVDRMLLNPMIELDNGGVVWGYQCWWLPYEQFLRLAESRTVVEVPFPDSAASPSADE